MAWRHRSKNEKILLRILGLLIFALTCFIVAVVVMDLTFKAKIRDLEDEIEGLKTTPTPPSATTITTDFTTIADTTTKVASTPPSTTTPSTTTITTITTTPLSTTTAAPTVTTTNPNVSLMTSQKAKIDPTHQLMDALQSLLFDYPGHISSSKNLEMASESGGVLRRTHGRFVIMADVQHEESKPVKKKSDSSKTDDCQDLSILDIDNMEHNTDIITTVPGETDNEDLTTAEYSGDSSTQYYPKDDLITDFL